MKYQKSVFLAAAVWCITSLAGPQIARAENSIQPIQFSIIRSDKAKKALPSQPIDFIDVKDFADTSREKIAEPLSKLPSKESSSFFIPDFTPPIAPTEISANAQSIFTINARWNDAQDPESGISSYVFGIGTNATGNFNELANVRWWQATHNKSISVNLSLDPNLTYYVSVYAVNGAGMQSQIITSNPIHPVWTEIGQPGNVMQLAFASSGFDINGAPTAGWTAEQIATMTSFFNRMYPILVGIYGPPATSYTVTAVRDLRYRNSNIFIPSTDEIRMDDHFNAQLFTHELIHAFRGDFILSSDQNWNYSPVLSSFEESFAQGVSYEAMNRYAELYPNDPIVSGNSLWNSSYDWDYDFQNMPELRTTDFWSDRGGTGIFWLRYEMGAEAIRKINIESPDFYRRFNQEYYRRINLDPVHVRPTRVLIVNIIRMLTPQIEGINTEEWINRQNIFYAQNVYGEKIFHNIQDYPSDEFFVFHDMYFTNTMPCGSEWVCWDGTQWVYHRLNGSHGQGSLIDWNGNVVWSGNLLIEPTQNQSDGYNGFGNATKNFTTAPSLIQWPQENPNDYIMNINTFGLYKFESRFTDPTTGAQTINSVYRAMGHPVANAFSGVWGGVLGHTTGIIYLNHDGFPDEPGIPVVNGAFFGPRTWTGVMDAGTGARNSIPGKIQITFVDANTGEIYHAQRNIDSGSVDGSQMFLFDFNPTATPSTIIPTAPIVAPLKDPLILDIFNIPAFDKIGIKEDVMYLDIKV